MNRLPLSIDAQFRVLVENFEPFDEPRDTWVRETVPNIEWAMPDQYPDVIPNESCPADLDGNEIVNVVDLLMVIAGWGTSSGDITGDGETDANDILFLIDQWGEC